MSRPAGDSPNEAGALGTQGQDGDRRELLELIRCEPGVDGDSGQVRRRGIESVDETWYRIPDSQ